MIQERVRAVFRCPLCKTQNWVTLSTERMLSVPTSTYSVRLRSEDRSILGGR